MGRSFVGILGFYLSSVDSESKDDGEAEKMQVMFPKRDAVAPENTGLTGFCAG